jgi:hypothetical protein
LYIVRPTSPCKYINKTIITSRGHDDKWYNVILNQVLDYTFAYIENVKICYKIIYSTRNPTDNLTGFVKGYWAVPWQNQHNGFATSMDPDQPAHPRSLIRIHAVRLPTLLRRLVCIHAGRKRTMLVLSWHGSNVLKHRYLNDMNVMSIFFLS